MHWNESVATSVAAWLFKGLYMFLQVYNIRINIDFFFYISVAGKGMLFVYLFLPSSCPKPHKFSSMHSSCFFFFEDT